MCFVILIILYIFYWIHYYLIHYKLYVFVTNIWKSQTSNKSELLIDFRLMILALNSILLHVCSLRLLIFICAVVVCRRLPAWKRIVPAEISAALDVFPPGEGDGWKDELLELARSKQERTVSELRCLRQVQSLLFSFTTWLENKQPAVWISLGRTFLVPPVHVVVDVRDVFLVWQHTSECFFTMAVWLWVTVMSNTKCV